MVNVVAIYVIDMYLINFSVLFYILYILSIFFQIRTSNSDVKMWWKENGESASDLPGTGVCIVHLSDLLVLSLPAPPHFSYSNF